jgi:PAS domain-containing protein
MDRPDITARTLAELARDPAFASFATPDAALLIWDAGATRLLGVSPAAERLRWAFADAAGRVDPQLGARGRLQALGAGLAPLAGLRLERLRLDGLSAPVTCACRRVMLDGEPVLVTALLGPLPKASPPRPASGSDRTEGPREGPAREPTEPPRPLPESGRIAPVSAAGPAPAAWVPPTLDALKRHGAVRIVWQADRDGRFTAISPALAGIVGPQAADVVGRTWGEVAGSVVDDPGGAVADLLSRRLTWSGLTVYWSVDGAPWRIPVVWAGLPVLAADRTLAGFRGFGLLRTEAAEPRGGAGLLGPDAPEAPAGEGTPTIGLPGPAVAAAARTGRARTRSWRTAALDAGDEPTGCRCPPGSWRLPRGRWRPGSRPPNRSP